MHTAVIHTPVERLQCLFLRSRVRCEKYPDIGKTIEEFVQDCNVGAMLGAGQAY